MVRAIYKALFDLKSGRVCYLPSGRDHVVSVDLNDVFNLRASDNGNNPFPSKLRKKFSSQGKRRKLATRW